ncbi:neuronal acetylcholine receptor subunit alpha-3-like [Dendronephthya gigantea]|uniref:neuronal acetylcholine receptor subunit alpha-3-like n=1 Tax=Dendronephthya gigantea TaxID=151771 RepID=UPI00106C1571|nr:neuronal acetylcholine receptor subunit alpha-3-like [Dendronephthya gigantea]
MFVTSGKLLKEEICAFLVILDTFVVEALTSDYDKNYEMMLIKKIMEDYKKKVEVRPVERSDQPIIVMFDLAYSQLINLDGKNQILTSNVWVRQQWINSKTTWNASDYGGVESIMMSPDYFWKPDIVLYNTIEGGGEMYNFDTKIVFYHDGRIQWNAPAQIKTICTIDITYFPFDEQKCKITFGSWSYMENALDMRLRSDRDHADLDRYTASGEWKLVSLNARRDAVKYTCCKYRFVTITYTVHIQRRVLFYMNNIIVPCIILNILTLLAFLLPHDSGERISLVITVLLGLTVYMLIFTENIPNSSVVPPMIGKFSMACFVEISACLLVTTFTSRCYFHGIDKKMPAWFHYLIFNIMAPAFLINIPKSEEEITDLEEDEESQNEMPVLATGLPLCSNGHSLPNGHAMPNSRMATGLPHSRSVSHIKGNSFQGGKGFSTHSVCNCEEQIQKILGILERFEEESQEKQLEEAKKEQWHFAAIILDRFFFILFGVTILICIVIFYAQIPSSGQSE